MKLERFESGVWKSRIQYKSFSPTLVNHAWVWEDPKINIQLEDASRALAELNAFSLIVPDIDLFVRMHVIKEATSSCRIEGICVEVDEAIQNIEVLASEKARIGKKSKTTLTRWITPLPNCQICPSRTDC